jgi:hypothetical protein
MPIVAGGSGAAFSPCRRWRYLLWRRWDGERPAVNFLMLNPSTATECKLDPTCARAREYAALGLRRAHRHQRVRLARDRSG